MKKFVDDISVQAVEQCLIQKLPTLFCPQTVHDFSDGEVARHAAESEGTTEERAKCDEKLEILEAGLRDLKRIDKHRLISKGMVDESIAEAA